MSNLAMSSAGSKSTLGLRGFPAVLNTVFISAVCALGAFAWWPIYGDFWFVLAAACSFLIAAAISFFCARAATSWWLQLLAIVVAYFVLAMTLGTPAVFSNPALLPDAAIAALVAPFQSWNDVLTLNLPLGHYQSTLALVVLVFTAIPAITFALLWRSKRWWSLSGASALSITVLGTVMGSSSVSAPWLLGPFVVWAPREVFTLLAAVVVLLCWYAWRAAYARAQAIAIARNANGARLKSRSAKGTINRSVLAISALCLAAVVSLLITPLALGNHTRDVPRSFIDPVQLIQQELSPLSNYRSAFSDDALDQIWFSVDTDAPIQRIHLATLGYYDGALARVLSADSNDSSQNNFVRVPASRNGSSSVAHATVTIEDYDSIWVPLSGELLAIDFQGQNRTALSDTFFYNHDLATGVVLSNLQSGDSYTLSAELGDDAVSVESLQPGGAGSFSSNTTPESLQLWLKANSIAASGAGLNEAISLLRESGYVSHGLSADVDGSSAAWMALYGDYSFQPSRSGHSAERIDALFQQLLKAPRSSDPNALPTVAAVGDDEQFAVAAALIAQQLGFESRVVLGMRLDVPAESALSVCENGACRGKNLAVWAEVRGNSSEWVALDASPQFERPITPEDQNQRDPEYPNEVKPDTAEQLLPPEAVPAGGAASDESSSEDQADFTSIWQYLRLILLALAVLFLLLGPLLWISIVKAIRKKRRRNAANAGDCVVGAWQEFIDFAVDRGAPRMLGATRSETAQKYRTIFTGSNNAQSLALAADRAVFAPTTASVSAADLYWQVLAQEQKDINNNLNFWQRLRAKFSIKSFHNRARIPQASTVNITEIESSELA